MSTVIVIAKEPVPGRVKTRLQTEFSAREAAALARASLVDTLTAVQAAPATRRVIALEGEPGPWLPRDFEVIGQRGDGLDERLAAAFEDAHDGTPMLLIGMDTPQLQPNLLGFTWATPARGRHDAAHRLTADGGYDTAHGALGAAADSGYFAGLRAAVGGGYDAGVGATADRGYDAGLGATADRGYDAVLGLTEDGGYWCLGLRVPDRRALVGVPMSTGHTGRDQLRRLRALGLRVGMLPTLRDMDTPRDAAYLAAEFPGLRVSRLYRRLQHSAHPGLLFDQALGGTTRVVATGIDGRTVPSLSELERWAAPADDVDRLALSRCEGPVLDIGCGPGRIVTALAERGIPALGVDVSPRAVSLTTSRGAAALHRPVQEPLPGEGRWGSVVLMDGNIGIGGDPVDLLRRCAELVRPNGLVLVEVDPDDDLDDTTPVVLRTPAGRRSTPLPWARVGTRALIRHARTTTLQPTEDWRTPHRAFLTLRRTA